MGSRLSSFSLALGASLIVMMGSAQASWTVTDTVDLSRYLRAYESQLAGLKDYMLSTTISSYRYATDATPHEVERTKLWKVGDRMRSEAFGTITVQDKSLSVFVDPEERMIRLSKPQGSLTKADAMTRTIMFMAAQRIRKTNDPLGVRFQLTFPDNAQFSTVEVVFDKEGWLRSITACWAKPIALEPSNPLTAVILPKVQVEFSAPTRIANKVDLEISNLVDRKGPTPKGVGAYAGYDVHDTRIQ